MPLPFPELFPVIRRAGEEAFRDLQAGRLDVPVPGFGLVGEPPVGPTSGCAGQLDLEEHLEFVEELAAVAWFDEPKRRRRHHHHHGY